MPRHPPTRRPAPPARPAVEPLEGRRLLSAGDPDPSFGAGGVRRLDGPGILPPGASAHVAVLDHADGKTVVAAAMPAVAPWRGVLVRLDADGSPDPTFGGGDGVAEMPASAGGAGLPTLPPPPWDGPDVLQDLRGLAVLPDGRVLVLAAYGRLLLRFTAAGELDRAFGGGDGAVDLGRHASRLAVGPGGRPVLLSHDLFADDAQYEALPRQVVVQRFLPGGAPDPSFGRGGVYRSPVARDFASDLAVQPDGKVVLAGARSTGSFWQYEPAVWRLTTRGAVDATFGGGDGMSSGLPADGSPIGAGESVAVDPQGRVVVGATSSNGGIRPFRLHPDGSFDRAFEPLGVAGNARARRVRVGPDGKVVVFGGGWDVDVWGGDDDVWELAARYTPDGRVDRSFGDGQGYQHLHAAAGAVEGGQAADLQADGRLVTAGYYVDNRSTVEAPFKPRLSVARYLYAGDPDVGAAGGASLSADGTLTVEGTAGNDSVTVTALRDGPFGELVRVRVRVNGHQRVFPLSAVARVAVRAGGGHDAVACNASRVPGVSVELHGGAGDDVLVGGDGADRLYGGAGDDRLEGEEGDDRLDGGAGNDALWEPHSLGGDNALFGGDGDDLLQGGDGADRLDGGRGADELHGGEGVDVLTYAGRRAAVAVDLADGRAADGEAGERDAAGDDIEVVEGGAGADTLRGAAAANVFYGNGGDDLLIGAGGDDVLWGGSGDDRLYGNAGRDRQYGGAGDDWLFGTDGRSPDLLDGGLGEDRARAGAGDVLRSVARLD